MDKNYILFPPREVACSSLYDFVCVFYQLSASGDRMGKNGLNRYRSTRNRTF